MSDTNKREYKIVKSWLGYNVYRKQELKNWMIKMERLQRDTYTLNKDFARTFYHLEDALSALTIAKCKEWKETSTTSIRKSESEERKEKTSWSEL